VTKVLEAGDFRSQNIVRDRNKKGCDRKFRSQNRQALVLESGIYFRKLIQITIDGKFKFENII